MRIVFMGTPDFALPSLQRLIDDGHELAAVYCQPDKPQGRHFILTPPPVKILAQRYEIPVEQPATLKSEEARRRLAGFCPELIVVAAYGKILPRAVLELPRYGCINVHGSLLPRYRGAAPIQWAVINNEPKSGVTIMRMAEGLDTGDMLLVRETPIGPDETAGELFDRVAVLGAQALSEAVAGFNALVPVPQDNALACWARPLTKSDGEADWSRAAEEIYAQIRGVSPWPGAYTFLDGKRLKIQKAARCAASVPSGCRAGAVFALEDGCPVVACGTGAILLREVQLEGGRRITGAEFVRGQRILPDCSTLLGRNSAD